MTEELNMQPPTKQTRTITLRSSPPNADAISTGSNGALKRSARDMPEPPPASKFHITDGSQNHLGRTHTTNYTGLQTLSSTSRSPMSPTAPSPSTPTSSDESPTSASTDSKPSSPTYQGHSVFQTGLPYHLATSPTSPTSPIPYHPHPPLKRWPNDYTVSEISSGFRQMDGLIAQTPTVVQRTAFERVFGCRYVKSTVCRHRGLWKKADPELREAYEDMGVDEKAVWGEFVRRVEGRPPGKVGQSQGQVLIQGQLVTPHRAQPNSTPGQPPSIESGQAEEAEDSVMGSLRLSLSPPNITMHQAASSISETQSGRMSIYAPTLSNSGGVTDMSE